MYVARVNFRPMRERVHEVRNYAYIVNLHILMYERVCVRKHACVSVIIYVCIFV